MPKQNWEDFNKEIMCDCEENSNHTISNPEKIKNFISKTLKEERTKIKKDLLSTADQGQYEDLRREVVRYFNNF